MSKHQDSASPARFSLPLWTERYASPPLPMSRAEMSQRGWNEVDVVFVTGDAYVDHPSFAMAILGLVLVLSPALVFGIINPKILDLNVDLSGLNPPDPTYVPPTRSTISNAALGDQAFDEQIYIA